MVPFQYLYLSIYLSNCLNVCSNDEFWTNFWGQPSKSCSSFEIDFQTKNTKAADQQQYPKDNTEEPSIFLCIFHSVFKSRIFYLAFVFLLHLLFCRHTMIAGKQKKYLSIWKRGKNVECIKRWKFIKLKSKTCFFSWSISCLLSFFLGQGLVFFVQIVFSFFFSWILLFSLSKACFLSLFL